MGIRALVQPRLDALAVSHPADLHLIGTPEQPVPQLPPVACAGLLSLTSAPLFESGGTSSASVQGSITVLSISADAAVSF
jgi:hypothetical protein